MPDVLRDVGAGGARVSQRSAELALKELLEDIREANTEDVELDIQDSLILLSFLDPRDASAMFMSGRGYYAGKSISIPAALCTLSAAEFASRRRKVSS